jgi:hypothetical protein
MIRQHPRSHSQGPLDQEFSERGYTKAKGEGRRAKGGECIVSLLVPAIQEISMRWSQNRYNMLPREGPDVDTVTGEQK